MSAAKARSFDMSIDLDAGADSVWKALTDAAELVRWFAPQATIDPRPGGAFVLSWDGDWVWDHKVADAVPGKRFRVVDRAARPYDAEGRPLSQQQPLEVVLEFTLEGRSGGTRLRLVHSGFGHGAAWDDYAIELATGDALNGTVIWADPSGQLVLDAHNRDHAFVRFGLDRMGGQVMASVWVSEWDRPEAETRAFAARFQQALERTFAQAPASVA